MSLRSVTFTTSGVWRAPKGVSSAWFMCQAPGGGGDAPLNFQASKASGGAGEFMCNVPMAVTADTFYTITLGGNGAGGVSAGSSNSSVPTNGGTTTVNGFNALGGLGVTPAAGATFGANGGGPGGGRIGNFQRTGLAGGRESPTAFGGASGSAGNSPGGGLGYGGAQQIGEYVVAGGSGGSGGAGGASSVLGAGGVGGNTSSGVPSSGGAATGYGGGGGGGGQDSTGSASGKTGGNGGDSFLTIFYIAP